MSYTVLYTGAFHDTTTQNIGAIDTPQPITINTTDLSNGISLQGTPQSQLKVSYKALYNFAFSAQLENTSGTTAVVDVWFAKNGTPIPDSNTRITLVHNEKNVAAWNIFLDLNVNDYIEIMWASDQTSVRVLSALAQTVPYVRPAVPSIILTVNKVNS